jgi:hemerythrin-like domain-containing protein
MPQVRMLHGAKEWLRSRDFTHAPTLRSLAMLTAAESPRATSSAALVLEDFAALDQCHQEVLKTLDVLGALIERLDRSGVDAQARQMAADITRFFNDSARQHHADEERQVFPGLLISGNSELVQHVQRLQQDHGWLEEDWLTLEPQLSAIASGYSWYDLDMLRLALPVFAELYLDHIELEESLIYPEAKALAAGRATAGSGRERSQAKRAQP